jgi:hypothetical protein
MPYIKKEALIVKKESPKEDFVTRRDREKIERVSQMLGCQKWTVKDFTQKLKVVFIQVGV